MDDAGTATRITSGWRGRAVESAGLQEGMVECLRAAMSAVPTDGAMAAP